MMYRDLIEKLEALGGPNSEIDVLIAIHVDGHVLERRGRDKKEWLYPSNGGFRRDPFYDCPRYTRSLDEVISLVERRLPGWAWKVGTCHVSDDAWLVPDFNHPEHGPRLRDELDHGSIKAGEPFDAGIDVDLRPPGRPAIALLIALLEALDLVASRAERQNND